MARERRSLRELFADGFNAGRRLLEDDSRRRQGRRPSKRSPNNDDPDPFSPVRPGLPNQRQGSRTPPYVKTAQQRINDAPSAYRDIRRAVNAPIWAYPPDFVCNWGYVYANWAFHRKPRIAISGVPTPFTDFTKPPIINLTVNIGAALVSEWRKALIAYLADLTPVHTGITLNAHIHATGLTRPITYNQIFFPLTANHEHDGWNGQAEIRFKPGQLKSYAGWALRMKRKFGQDWIQNSQIEADKVIRWGVGLVAGPMIEEFEAGAALPLAAGRQSL